MCIYNSSCSLAPSQLLLLNLLVLFYSSLIPIIFTLVVCSILKVLSLLSSFQQETRVLPDEGLSEYRVQ